MSPTGDESRAGRRRPSAPDGEPWDDATWVDVGSDNRWRPTLEERSRSVVILAVVLGVFLLGAAFASIDDGDGDREVEVAVSSTTTSSVAPTTTTTTTAPPEPNSVGGEVPPAECAFDDRGASPLRDRSDATVLVLNGTAKGGLAGSTNDDLEALGYSSMPPDNASTRSVTSIEYVPGNCAEAVRAVADLGVPTATVGPVDPASGVVLGRAVLLITLGRDSL